MDNWRLEEQVFAKVMRNIPFGMVVCREGSKRKVYYVNQAAYTMLGYTRDEYVQMVQNGWHNFIHVDIREIIRENHEAICSGEEFEVITKARKKDGQEVYLWNRVVIRMEDAPISYINITDVTERVKKEKMLQKERESLRRQATQDSFTKLLNRGTMEKKINTALMYADNQQECAYIALDLDNFKQINDFYGHGVGDMLILELAELLKKYFEKDSYIGRMGGDEFAVFLRDSENREEIVERANGVRCELHDLKHRLALQEEPSVSIGIAFGQKTECSFQELYRSADIALYQIKNEQKNGIAVLG